MSNLMSSTNILCTSRN